ncbi:hypothetical protein EG328_006786 [Venturia inaequalis]|uniref:DUF3492 domain-containing protein n=1 Tax=Venturia inaequalis TaxID=5025 RepID=A0A8H3UGJ3_VENIN|nr:hypothetical protein EG328_006786 [Venturia inaequalis]
MSFPPTQFAAGDWASEVCNGSQYLIYCDSLLPTSERVEHWYQWLNISLAAAAFLLPVLFWVSKALRTSWQHWRLRKLKAVPVEEKTINPFADEMEQSAVAMTVLEPSRVMTDNTMAAPYIKVSPDSSTEGFDYRPPTMDFSQYQSPSDRNSVYMNSNLGTSNSSLNSQTAMAPERTSMVDLNSPGNSVMSSRIPSAMSMGSSRPASPSLRPGNDRAQRMSFRELVDEERQSSYGASGFASPALSLVSARSSFESDGPVLPGFLRAENRLSMESINLRPEADSEIAFNPLQNFDLRITPLFTKTGKKESRFSTMSKKGTSAKTVLALVDLEDLGPDAFLGDLLETVHELDMLRMEKMASGFVVKIHDDVFPTQTVSLLEAMTKQGVQVMLMCDTDAEILRSIDFDMLFGVILENSTILINGERRDFFRSDRMRGIMSRCAEVRVERPTFFLGFHDLWETRPSAAVVRRAFKLAEFFGATLTHGPFGQQRLTKFPISMSGFDYLKGNQIVDLQKAWVNESSQVQLNEDPVLSNTVPLSIDKLKRYIPLVERLLEPMGLPEDLETKFEESVITTLPPAVLSRAPGRRNFWNLSSDGEILSPLGCYPLNRPISRTQYDAILESQEHLKTLNMLHQLDEVEVLKLTDRLRTILDNTKHRHLVDSLVLGLTFGHITVYTALDSAFSVPGDAHAWGVSNSSTSSHLDIFTSQKTTSLASTVLHVFLAQHGIPREQRFQEEMLLEGPAVDLPLSLRAELRDSTNSELLFVLEQIKVSALDHPFATAIQRTCVDRLLNDASREEWTEIHSKRFLEGSISIRDLLQLRLEEFARRGARKLPCLDNLEQLYQSVDFLISDSLFWAEREKLETLSAALVDVYKPLEDPSKRTVDLRADLFALIFFCSLRKHAFDNVFLESTDRCPFFLTQPDQAGVFSELWVLGSQCDIYFGILPRAVGKIIFDRYRAQLALDPPPADAFDKKNVFTAYSFSHSAKNSSKIVKPEEKPSLATRVKQKMNSLSHTVMEFGALSIFCMPAIVDVVLLTWLGRGFFLTAFMDVDDRIMAAYALLASLLLTAGNTGWTGSVGGHYLYNFAFHNMNFFLVSRLAGGFVLSLLVSAAGFVAFSIQMSPRIAAVFVAYVIVLCTYLNILGNLCHEWNNWTNMVPIIKSDEVVAWYQTIQAESECETEELKGDALSKAATTAFQDAVEAHTIKQHDPLVSRAAKGLPFALWLLEKESPNPDKNAKKKAKKDVDRWSKIWLSKVEQALKSTQQLAQGLKEHSVFVLYRYGQYDMAQSFGLFLIALMDHWVNVAMSAHPVTLDPFEKDRSRYSQGLCVLFFLMSAIALDATLQPYWEANSKLSSEKLVDAEHARIVARQSQQLRRRRWVDALIDLMSKIACVFGVTTGLVCLLTKDAGQIIMYYGFVVGYLGVLIFQFNRCFTTNARAHVMSVFVGALVGFATGCALHAIPATSSFYYTDVLSIVIASLTATALTTVWVFVDPELAALTVPTVATARQEGGAETGKDQAISFQFKIGSDAVGLAHGTAISTVAGPSVRFSDTSPVAQRITQLLDAVPAQPDHVSPISAWPNRVLETASSMWRDGAIAIVLSNRQAFEEHDLEDVWSFAEYRSGQLIVSVGFLDVSELNLYQNQLHDKLAYLLTETILYHSTTTIFGLSPRHALRAEGLLRSASSLAGRIELQLATEDEATLMRLLSKTNADLLKPLCLNLDVNTEWNKVPVGVRKTIISRVSGESTPWTSSMEQWMNTVSKDIELEDFHVALCLRVYQLIQERLKTLAIGSDSNSTSYGAKKMPAELQWQRITSPGSGFAIFSRFLLGVVNTFVVVFKWVSILSGAASEVERELWYVLQGLPLHQIVLVPLLIFWRICWLMKNTWITILLIYRRPSLKRIVRLAMSGSSRDLVRNSIVVELSEKTITGFASHNIDGRITLDIFNGAMSEQPKTLESSIAQSVYDENCRLRFRVDQKEGQKVHTTYYYDSKSGRTPAYKEVVQNGRTLQYRYDKYGRIASGNGHLGLGDAIGFTYHYRKAPKHNCDILRAVFLTSKKQSMTVYWSVVDGKSSEHDDMAVPSERVLRVVKIVGGKRYITKWTYEHKRDPRTATEEIRKDGGRIPIAEAPVLFAGEADLFKKPSDLSFDCDDLLRHHSRGHLERMFAAISPDQSSIARIWSRAASVLPFGLSYWSRHVTHERISTWRLRAELWTIWLKTNDLDAVTACWIDELILRQEPLLSRYWRLRNLGFLFDAKNALDEDIEQIVPAIEMPFEVSQTCVLPIKPSDLYAMGLAKDATQITNRPQDCYKDTKDRISVIFNDVGCWPDAPGGVSNCRRDLVNGHSTIRNHVLAESAHDYGISRFQLERNVQSLKALPLWGLDFKTAQHGIIDNLLQSQVDEKINDTYAKQDIVQIFIPALWMFVKGSRTKHATRKQLLGFSNAMLTMAAYFEKKDYNKTWRSKEVETAWVQAWLHPYHDPNILDPSELFELERPSMEDFRESLALYMAYFVIYSVKIPDECPRVFQSTHHGISSLFGMVLKYKKGATFGLWDHAILWRECCLNISTAQCLLPISVQAQLLAGIGLAARLAYLHVDILLPCTSVFNPVWEAEIGTDGSLVGPKALFNRKIDPIANGISNMANFEPTTEPLAELPTVVMLSNIQTIKDVKAAVLAADHIINDFGFEDYRLHIYGAQDREPSYTMETLQIIADRNLTGKVVLAGFGNPKKVLKDAWLFVNSSLSEGLPLAIGEAALTGVPIVATEVGGTSLVLTDPDDSSCKYGEVVPPNDPLALARAQINVLSMSGQWAQYTDDKDDPPYLPIDFTPEDVKRIMKRMYDKSADRRTLGLKCREVVLRSFHGNRYLREHEQMYWIQWRLARMRTDETLTAEMNANVRFGIPAEIRCEISADEDDETAALVEEYGNVSKEKLKKYRWQDFEKKKVVKKKNKKKVEENARAKKGNSLEAFRTGGQKTLGSKLLVKMLEDVYAKFRTEHEKLDTDCQLAEANLMITEAKLKKVEDGVEVVGNRLKTAQDKREASKAEIKNRAKKAI